MGIDFCWENLHSQQKFYITAGRGSPEGNIADVIDMKSKSEMLLLEKNNIWSFTWLLSGLLKIPDSNLELHQMHIAPKEEKAKGHCKSCDEVFLSFELNF